MAKLVRKPGPSGRNILNQRIDALDGVQGRVGWFPSAKYEDGTPVAGVAMVQEFGSPARAIPPRSFMRSTAAEQVAGWRDFVGQGAKAVMTGNTTMLEVVDGLGTIAAGDIRHKIATILTPALRPLTLLARKYRRGMFPDIGTGPLTGRTLGILMAKYKAGEIDTDGVSTKPLNDTGLMMATLTHEVSKT